MALPSLAAAALMLLTGASIVVAIVVGGATLTGLFFGVRYKTSYAAASAAAEELRKSLTDEKARHEQASAERKELLAVVASQKETIARLEALPNLERVIRFMDEATTRADARAAERIDRMIERVEALVVGIEERDGQRHRALLDALALGRRDG